jgi:hypothetical protein
MDGRRGKKSGSVHLRGGEEELLELFASNAGERCLLVLLETVALRRGSVVLLMMTSGCRGGRGARSRRVGANVGDGDVREGRDGGGEGFLMGRARAEDGGGGGGKTEAVGGGEAGTGARELGRAIDRGGGSETIRESRRRTFLMPLSFLDVHLLSTLRSNLCVPNKRCRSPNRRVSILLIILFLDRAQLLMLSKPRAKAKTHHPRLSHLLLHDGRRLDRTRLNVHRDTRRASLSARCGRGDGEGTILDGSPESSNLLGEPTDFLSETIDFLATTFDLGGIGDALSLELGDELGLGVELRGQAGDLESEGGDEGFES